MCTYIGFASEHRFEIHIVKTSMKMNQNRNINDFLTPKQQNPSEI